MKILTGRLRGRILLFKPNSHLRPTSDKVRKALFDTLKGAVEGKNVLDLFSGTGALGFEALSGGAADVTFVENDRNQCRKIEENIRGLGLEDQARVWNGDVEEALGIFASKARYFDIVFLDPPYGKNLGLQTLTSLSKLSLVPEGGFIVLESRKGEMLPERCGLFRAVKAKRYGDTQITIYQRNPVSI
jgi:16S rRNA (guanine(966)-N(2))-methyltransferase RsmD